MVNIKNTVLNTKKSSPKIKPVPAVSRAIAIVRVLGLSSNALSLKNIADTLNLHSSTCLHILRVLTEERVVNYDPITKRYRLGIGILTLTRSVQEKDPFVQIAQPILDDISEKWGVTAIGVEVMGLNSMVVAALSHSKLAIRLHVDVGSRFPGLISTTGRLVAAFGNYTDEELIEEFERLRWGRQLSFEEWETQVRNTRVYGFAVDRGDYIAGVTLLAVPVLNRVGDVRNTIVVLTISEQLSDAAQMNLLTYLKKSAAIVEQKLYSVGK